MLTTSNITDIITAGQVEVKGEREPSWEMKLEHNTGRGWSAFNTMHKIRWRDEIKAYTWAGWRTRNT